MINIKEDDGPSESLEERRERHDRHKKMLSDHRETKERRRQMHRKGFHRMKIPPNCYT